MPTHAPPDMGGRVAVVTGASSGLGVHTAVGLSKAGAAVAIVARREGQLEETSHLIEQTGGRCLPIVGDVADPATGQRVVELVNREFGKVDVLVNNAGVGTAVPATRETPEEFRRVIQVNLEGAYWMAQACGRTMASGSAIVNVSSVLAFTTARLPQAAYASSKAALVALTRDLAAQWTPRKGIRVNAIVPGFFETEMTDGYPSGYYEEVIQPRILMGRKGQSHEYVNAMLFLCSDNSSYITGTTLAVDGGLLAT